LCIIIEKGEDMLKARDIMTRDVITVRPSMTIEEFARLLMKHQISGAPVVDESGSLIGIVTENDLITQNKRLHIPTILRLFDAFIPLGTSRLEKEIKKITATTVREICTERVVSVGPETTIDEIATIMTEKKIHLIPVVEEGRIVGIIGKKDIIKGVSGETSEQRT
jgi:CBS-domain-containing membrane protein